MKGLLTCTESFVRSVYVKRVQSVPDTYSLCFRSQSKQAKDPNAEQTNFMLVTDGAGLRELASVINAELIEQEVAE